MGEEVWAVYKVGSLCVFPRQVNEHAKSKVNMFFLFSVCFTDFHTRIIFVKEELELEKQQGVEKEPMNRLSELELLSSHYLQNQLPSILEALLCSDNLMTDELWKW